MYTRWWIVVDGWNFLASLVFVFTYWTFLNLEGYEAMKRLFWLIGWLAQIGRLEPNFEYPQTWYLVSKIAKRGTQRRKRIERLCDLLTGHELSKTEWGYGGGAFADRHCRWCDKLIRVPKESLFFEFPMARDLMSEVGKTVKE